MEPNDPPYLPAVWELLDMFEKWCEGGALDLFDIPTPELIAGKKRELEEMFWAFYTEREDISYRRYLFTIYLKWHFRLDHYWFFFHVPTCVLRR